MIDQLICSKFSLCVCVLSNFKIDYNQSINQSNIQNLDQKKKKEQISNLKTELLNLHFFFLFVFHIIILL